MNIALDYDGTFTAAPELWLAFIASARILNHRVYIVTMRYPSECDGTHGQLDDRLTTRLVHVIPTSRQAKRPFCESRGINIDIWIDDNPKAVDMDADQVWAGLPVLPEGKLPQEQLA